MRNLPVLSRNEKTQSGVAHRWRTGGAPVASGWRSPSEHRACIRRVPSIYTACDWSWTGQE